MSKPMQQMNMKTVAAISAVLVAVVLGAIVLIAVALVPQQQQPQEPVIPLLSNDDANEALEDIIPASDADFYSMQWYYLGPYQASWLRYSNVADENGDRPYPLDSSYLHESLIPMLNISGLRTGMQFINDAMRELVDRLDDNGLSVAEDSILVVSNANSTHVRGFQYEYMGYAFYNQGGVCIYASTLYTFNIDAFIDAGITVIIR